jgi:hypothetical protein
LPYHCRTFFAPSASIDGDGTKKNIRRYGEDWKKMATKKEQTLPLVSLCQLLPAILLSLFFFLTKTLSTGKGFYLGES